MAIGGGLAIGVIASLAGIPATSSALADTFLCQGGKYSVCVNAGYTDHGYGQHNSVSYWHAFPGHNCTNYVTYVQTTLGVAEPSFRLGDAWTWWSAAAGHVAEDQTPAVGAVAWWGKNDPGSGSGGHVASVEAVAPDGAVTVSEDSYPKGPFAWRVIAVTSPSYPRGFIHFSEPAATGGGSPAATPVVGWGFENLDGTASSPGGHVTQLGQYPAPITYQGTLNLFYYDRQYGYLRHAWYDGAGWRFEVLDGAGGANGRTLHNTGLAPFATVAGGALSVFYYDATSRVVRRAWLDAAGWHYQVIDNGGPASAAVWFRGTLHVFYPDPASGVLRHGWLGALGVWRSENLDGAAASVAGRMGAGVASAGDSLTATVYRGAIRVLYHGAAGVLRFASFDGGGWRFASLDGGASPSVSGDTDHVGQNPSVVTAGNDLHVFSYDATVGDLRHAWFDGTGWAFENLDGPTRAIGPDRFNVGLYSAAVVTGGTLRVLYYDSAYRELRLATRIGSGGWQFVNLDGLGGSPATRVRSDVGQYVAAVSYRGVTHAFYYDAAQSNLRHAWKR